MNQESKEEIYRIIEENPGATGAIICGKLVAKTWAAKWFGPDSVWAMVLSPSIAGGVYPHLYALENEGRVRGEWGMKVCQRARRRHYYPVLPHG